MVTRLDYTDDMIEQDKRWQTNDHNPSVSITLYEQIIEQAKRKGFLGDAHIQIERDSVVANIYETKDMFQQAKLGIDIAPTERADHCLDLIRKLERLLNKKRVSIKPGEKEITITVSFVVPERITTKDVLDYTANALESHSAKTTVDIKHTVIDHK